MAGTFTGTVVGYFTSEGKAETAVEALKAAGFQSGQIGIALAGEGSAATTEGTTSAPAATSTTAAATHSSASAHAAGAPNAWERFKSFFDGGSDVEPYADESSRGASTAHEITGHTYDHDEFAGSLTGLDVSEDRSKYFSHKFGSQNQGAVVTVSASGRENEAEAILEQNGGDVGADTTGYDYSKPVANTTGQQRIQLLGEVLRVQKERVSRGEVRIRKEVITEQQTIQVPVTREELVIERIPVSGSTAVAGAIGAESEIRIPLTEEHAYAEKSTVVREEIAVGKRAVEGVEQVGGAVRHEELEVEESTSGVTTPATTGKL